MITTPLHTKFQENLAKDAKECSSLLLAISCGQDSLCLLKLISDCINNKFYQIKAIYIDHQWKADSLNHTKHIINIMKTKRIPITIYQCKYLALSENKARQVRYQVLIQHALKEKFKAIITGHNNNDLIETSLHNIIRGTSLNGITNLISYKKLNNKISILRPLINISRSEITWFCRLFYLPIWSDITNYNFQIKRNRLRYELIPYLENYFNPQIKKNLNQLIKICQNENEYIKENTLKLYMRCTHKLIISLNLTKLMLQHEVLKKRVIKLFFYYHFQKQISERTIIKILKLCKKKKSQTILFSKLIIYFKNNQLYITMLKKLDKVK